MFAVAVPRPAKPWRDCLFVGFRVQLLATFAELGGGTAEILFYAFPDELLLPVELETDVIKRAAVLVLAVLRYREYLPVALYLKPQRREPRVYEARERLAQPLLAVAEKHDVVGVFGAVHAQHLVCFVHEVAQHEVRQVLAKVIADGQALRAVDYPVNEP